MVAIDPVHPTSSLINDETRAGADLACVVMSVGARPELAEAVRSLCAQRTPCEVVVVNSGGGDVARVLAEAGLEAKIVESAGRLLPGATRNRGIEATSAPFIAFLAADCIAEPGWVDARIAAHRRGSSAVATAVTNAYRSSVVAWTSYVALFNRRMPGLGGEEALRYGASYSRDLFTKHGFFREDLRGGEDTEFHERLPSSVDIAWVPSVRTAHRHPRTIGALLRDQYRRGTRSAAAWARLNRYGALTVAADAWRRMRPGFVRAWRAAERGERRWIAGTLLLLPMAVAAYSAGAVLFAARRSGGEEE